MKTIGLIGGSTDVATVEYYKLINANVRERLGGYHTGKIIINSMDVAASVYFVKGERWDEGGEHLREIVQSLDRAGADFIICCSNTWHRCAEGFMAGAKIPLLHICNPTGEAIKAQNLKRIALLGTKSTMSSPWIREFYAREHGIEIVVPNEEQQDLIDAVIFQELSYSLFLPKSRAAYLEIVDDLQGNGAEGVILGCTEIGLLIQQKDRPNLSFFDTLALHAEAAAKLATQDIMPN